jgi:hypothetical protein
MRWRPSADTFTPASLRLLGGAAATALWLLFIVWYVATGVGLGNLVQFNPNELGEFLTGAFAPPALLWLVIGFFHQWGRIDENTQALRDQQADIERIVAEVGSQSIAIKHHELQVNRDSFLRMADVYLTELNALAADMIMRVERDYVEAAWNKYSMGDKQAIFRDAIERIREYKDAFVTTDGSDPAHSEVVNRYIWVAEELLSGAYRCDVEIGRYYEFSPCGTLYAALCFLVRREGRFKLRAPIASIEDMRW